MKTKKIIRWTLVNGTFAGMLIAGLNYDIQWAENIGLFMVWICFAFSLPIFMLSHVKPNELRSIELGNYDLENIFNAIILAILAGNAYWFSAVAYLIHSISILALQQGLKEMETN